MVLVGVFVVGGWMGLLRMIMMIMMMVLDPERVLLLPEDVDGALGLKPKMRTHKVAHGLEAGKGPESSASATTLGLQPRVLSLLVRRRRGEKLGKRGLFRH